MSAAAYLDFFAPEFGGVAPGDKDMALSLAEGFRPPCLLVDRADQAVAYYAAYLLSERAPGAQAAENPGGDSGSGSAGYIMPRKIKSEKEGDLSREYEASGSSASGGSSGSATGPSVEFTTEAGKTYFSKWQSLAAICTVGESVVGRPHARRY